MENIFICLTHTLHLTLLPIQSACNRLHVIGNGLLAISTFGGAAFIHTLWFHFATRNLYDDDQTIYWRFAWLQVMVNLLTFYIYTYAQILTTYVTAWCALLLLVGRGDDPLHGFSVWLTPWLDWETHSETLYIDGWRGIFRCVNSKWGGGRRIEHKVLDD